MEIKVFERKIEEAQARLGDWLKRSLEVPPTLEELCQLTEEIVVALEELQVALEEIYVQQATIQAANQELQAERQRYRELFDYAPDGYLITDHWGTIQEANLTASEMLNRRLEHLIGKPMSVFIPQLERRSFYDLLQNLRQEESIKCVEIGIQPSSDRASLTAAISIASVRDEQNQLIGFRWLLRDVTQLREAQAESQRQQERSRLLAEVALKIRQSWQLEEIWQTAVTESQKLLKADEVIIVQLASDNSGTVVAEASSAEKSDLLSQNLACNFLLTESKRQDLFGISQIIPKYYFKFTPIKQLKKGLHQSELTNLIAPVFVRQKLWGFLAFHRCETAYQWEDFEMDICQQLADHIGIAVTQAQFICNMEELVDQQTKELRTSNQLLQQEIIKRRQMEQQLAHDALHDALTGLPNRALLRERIEFTIQHAKRNRDYLFALLFIDLDRFKTINDSLGHLMGDRLLIAVAQFFQESLRDNDLVVRLGGDEFVILLDGIHGLQDATQIAARILERFASPFEIEDRAIFTSASIGIVLSSSNYDNGADILRDADIAMYRAKEKGKACYEVFDRAMYLETLKVVETENDLRQALQWGELFLKYQPIISLSSGELVGLEALIRWRHPQRGLILPSEFIPIAEDTGLIVPIGEWLLAEACRQIKVWQQKFASVPQIENLKIGINVTSQQFQQPQFIEKLDEILLATGLDASCLRLEITESVLVESGATIQNTLAEIKKRKIKLSIDDFGTGYSCLSYLSRFPIDNLKIDRSFVERMNVDGENFEIVRTIITLATTLAMETIAEGVETTEQLTQLENLGCQCGQGYLFAEPLDAQEIESLLVNMSDQAKLLVMPQENKFIA